MANKSVKDKWESLVAKLLRLTEEGTIKWTAEELDSELTRSDERVVIVFTASHLGQNLRIYEYEEKFWPDEDQYEWTNSLRLELTDASDDPS